MFSVAPGCHGGMCARCAQAEGRPPALGLILYAHTSPEVLNAHLFSSALLNPCSSVGVGGGEPLKVRTAVMHVRHACIM